MDWLQLSVSTNSRFADVVSDILISAGSSGTVVEDKAEVAAIRDSKGTGGWDIIDDSLVEAMPENVRVTGYYACESAETALEKVKLALEKLEDAGDLTIETKSIGDENWAENWKDQFSPIRLGNSFLITPSWCDFDKKPGDHVIEIDPGLAFGTGAHETTGMCVELVERYVKPGDTMIDVGTGSAILAIAASMLGARDVLAIDIDPLAVKTAQDNVVINKAQNVRVVKGDLLDNVDEVANVVTANIIADVVMAIAKPVKSHILPGGYFICSGIPSERSDEVLTAIDQAGYILQEIMHKGEWVAICAKKSC